MIKIAKTLEIKIQEITNHKIVEIAKTLLIERKKDNNKNTRR